jgi:hypothetical protein
MRDRFVKWRTFAKILYVYSPPEGRVPDARRDGELASA